MPITNGQRWSKMILQEREYVKSTVKPHDSAFRSGSVCHVVCGDVGGGVHEDGAVFGDVVGDI